MPEVNEKVRSRSVGPATRAAGHCSSLWLTLLCGLPFLLAAPPVTAESIFAACWSDPWPKPWLRGGGAKPIKLEIRNQSSGYLEICVYDRVCQTHIFSGQMFRRSKVILLACSNKARQGSILVIDRSGRVLPYNNLKSQTIKLPVKGQKFY